ncbi:hypothetical protein QBC47DRAFT_370428 [Echria macrotheca]|uniref:Uncharacterized protein n=1 Tax=Echria macrotheca TaxID=438768 RepID=A0AAJ0BRA2_9PEZI|nr:hypothetical protein QBC47DRAFT_370428 [Echria macrotheca]
MARNQSLSELLTKVVSAIRVVDEQVLRSDYIRDEILQLQTGDRPVPYNYADPEAHLENSDAIGLWEDYFEHLLKVWDEDDDGDILSEAKFNFIIDRLTAAASTLDHYGQRLGEAYRRIPSIPEARLQGIDRRRTVLNGFLNSAEITLEHWYRHAGLLKERTLRQRRKIPDAKEETVKESEVISKEQSDSTRQARTPRKILSRAVLVVISNSTLVSLTFIITIAAAIVQAYSYKLATGTGQTQRGTWDSPDCFSTIQSCLMQLLGLYVTVLPALRHRHIRRSYARWSLVLAVLGIISTALSIVCFVYSPAMSQLTLFLGSAIQAAIVMQLVWAVDEVVSLESIEGKRE